MKKYKKYAILSLILIAVGFINLFTLYLGFGIGSKDTPFNESVDVFIHFILFCVPIITGLRVAAKVPQEFKKQL